MKNCSPAQKEQFSNNLFSIINPCIFLVVPRFYALSNSLNQVSPTVEALTQVEVDGIFAGATLSYKDMLVLLGTIRRDAPLPCPKPTTLIISPPFPENSFSQNYYPIRHG